MTKRERIMRCIAYALWGIASGLLFLFFNAWITFAVLIGTALLPCLFLLFAFWQSRKISLSCDCSRTGAASVSVKVGWKGCRLPALLSVCFFVRNVFTGEEGETRREFFLLGKGEEGLFASDLVGKTEQKITFFVSDLFGFFRFPVRTEFSAEKFALPEERELSVFLSALPETIENFFSFERAKADGGERSSFHAYREGEPIKNVHWKLSARSEELVVSERTEPLSGGVALLLGSADRNAVSFFFSLSAACVKAEILHSLFALDERDELKEFIVEDSFSFESAMRQILSVPFCRGVERAFRTDERGFSRVLCVNEETDFLRTEVAL